MPKILVVEDDRKLNQTICYALEKAGYIPYPAHSAYLQDAPHLVLLDVNLPDGEGFLFCQWIRSQSSAPVLFLTARDLEEDALTGYELGAEDYVTKPFSIKLVLKRVEALLRRTSSDTVSDCIRYKEISLSETERKVTVSGNEVPLTHSEFEILMLFLKNKGRVFTRDDLLNLVWGYDFVGDEKGVNFHIMNLRRKLDVDCIETIRGVGYKIEKEN